MPQTLWVLVHLSDEYRDQGYDKEGRIDVGHKVRLAIRVVGEDGLEVGQHAEALVSIPMRMHTLARKLDAVHRNTVRPSNDNPITLLHERHLFEVNALLARLAGRSSSTSAAKPPAAATGIGGSMLDMAGERAS